MRISDWSSDVCSSDLQAAADSCHIAQYRLLRAADVADDRTGLQRAHATAECFGRMQHRHREHHQIGIAHGRRSIVEHRSEEHTSELQSLMRISYAVFCLKKQKQTTTEQYILK